MWVAQLKIDAIASRKPALLVPRFNFLYGSGCPGLLWMASLAGERTFNFRRTSTISPSLIFFYVS
jgi:hypothetical protein